MAGKKGYLGTGTSRSYTRPTSGKAIATPKPTGRLINRKADNPGYFAGGGYAIKARAAQAKLTGMKAARTTAAKRPGVYQPQGTGKPRIVKRK